MGGTLDKNVFILELKFSALKNLLLRVKREEQFPWEHPFFFVDTILRVS